MFKFRPHHLICNLCFQGNGYNARFTKRLAAINKTLLTNPHTKYIQIVNGTDDICIRCPKNKAGKCEHETSTALIDDSYYTILRLSIGEIVSLNDVIIKTKRFLSMNSFRDICGQCPWKHLCEPALSKINSCMDF